MSRSAMPTRWRRAGTPAAALRAEKRWLRCACGRWWWSETRTRLPQAERVLGRVLPDARLVVRSAGPATR